MKYFYVWGRNEPHIAVADAPKDIDIHSKIADIKEDPRPIVFTVTEGEVRDYLANNVGWHLCSEKIKLVFDAYRLKADLFDWYPVTVKDGDKEISYFALFFSEVPDILDAGESLYIPESNYIRRPALRADVLEDMSVATFEETTGRWIIAADVKAALKGTGCTGITFDEAYIVGRVKRRSRKLILPVSKAEVEKAPLLANSIPDDLYDFLASGKNLKYQPSACEPGKVSLKKVSKLELLYVEIQDESHHDNSEAVRIPAVSLIDECEGYDPEFVLLWLPEEKLYGTFDGDHCILWVFPKVGWKEIVANPVPYLNAQWEENSSVAELFNRKM
jgi:hypothetical protein